MSTIEKLQAIRARCVELLAIAEKRTPGEWSANNRAIYVSKNPECEIARYSYEIQDNGEPTEHDATFIAAAAGPFEAALKSTIAAIDGLIDEVESICDPSEDRAFAWKACQDIIAAWEGIL